MCIGHFATTLDIKLLEKLMEAEIQALDANAERLPLLLTHLQALSQITGAVGEKLSKYFASFVPKLMSLL